MPEKSVGIIIKVGVKGVAEKEKLIQNLKKLGDTATKTSSKTQQALQSISPTMQGLWQQADKLSQHWGVAFQSALPYVKKLGNSFKANTTDTYQLAQAADFVSKKFKVSFGETYNTLKRMGVGFKGVSVDTDKTAKAARKFASEWGVSFQDAFKYQLRLGTGVRKSTSDIRSSFQAVSHDIDKTAKIARTFAQNWGVSFNKAYSYINRLGANTKKVTSAVYHDIDKTSKIARTFAQNWGVSFKKAYDHVSKLGVGMKKTEKQVAKSSKGIGYQLTFVAWHFRYLGNIFDRVSKSIIRGIKNVIKVSAELEESFLSIRTAAVLYGKNAEEATELSRKLALTGLIPLTESANAVKNLMIGGLGVPEMERFVYRFLDVAFLWTSSADGMTKALNAIIDSVLRGKPKIGMETTALNIWRETNERLEKSLGTSLEQLSKRGRLLAILQTIEEDYADTLGLHEMEMETTRAAMTRLNTSITLIKDALGRALIPLLEATASVLVKVSVYVEHLVNVLGPTISVMTALALVFSVVIAKVAFAIGIFLSFFQIMKQLQAMSGIVAISMWKIYLPLIAIGAVVGGATYLFLKYSGALDKAKQSAANVTAQLKRIQGALEGVEKIGEEEIGVEEGRRIAHERTTEDIMEDLERERSKGLWANQMTIKDLEKRLKRENEDWNRYLDELGNKDVDDPTAGLGLGGVFGDLLNDANTAAEELGRIDWFKGLTDPASWAKVRDAILGVTDGIMETVSDPNFWRFFGEELATNMGNIITGIGDTIKASFEGLFGSVMKGVAVVAASTFVIAFGVAFLKNFSVGGVGFLAGTSAATSLGTAFTAALLAAVPTTLSITLVLISALALSEAIKFKLQIDEIKNSLDRQEKTGKELMDVYIQKFKDGTMEADIFKKKTEDLVKWQKESAAIAAEASWSWGKFFKGEYLTEGLSNIFMKDGGIVPGLPNQPVPIIAHGGERVIPAGEVGGGGNITVNINNPTVRNQEDINSIARAVSNVLGQRQRFSKLGAL